MAFKALVAGGSGLVGGFVVQHLLKDPDCISVISIGRKHLDLSHKKLQQEVVDFDQLNLYADLFKVDIVFCCLGSTIKKAGSKENFRKVDYEYPMNMANVSVSNSVKVFSIITALGSSSKSMIFYNKVKGEVEDSLKKLAIPSVNILQPSLLMGSRGESRLGESIAQSAFNFINPFFAGPLKKYRGIQGEQVAKAMVSISKKGEKGFHQFPSDMLFDY